MNGTRVVAIEEVCQHGNVKCWELLNPDAPLGAEGEWCENGSRRVLTEGQYVLIEKADEFVGEFGLRLIRRGDTVTPERAVTELLNLLDALSDHTEGTP